MNKYIEIIAKNSGIAHVQVKAVIDLLADKATIPFIARYRKEKTGSLDEVAIQTIRDLLITYEKIGKRKIAILKSLMERELLSTELSAKIAKVETLIELEDLYLPYKQKKKSRASVAIEQGLKVPAEQILTQTSARIDLNSYINPAKKLPDIDTVEQGISDIIAEMVSEHTEVRYSLRNQFTKQAILTAKVIIKKKTEAIKFKNYFDFQGRLEKVPSHRLLAILRGENEGFLRVHALPDEERAVANIRHIIMGNNHSPYKSIISAAITDSYKRLCAPSLESETLKNALEIAHNRAIEVFSANLTELLLAPPLGQKCIIAIDPGFRTGCKTVVLDKQGKLLDTFTIFPFDKNSDTAAKKIATLVKEANIEAIAVGNGTAGRETEAFINNLKLNVPVIAVNESGASIYSASQVARDEFPDYDITVRGAVSIGRRLQDPLAELVKIDPKSIGVGQYQHDVDQRKLKIALDDVVSFSVNKVGVELNSASIQLLTSVAGIGPQVAENIVNYRNLYGSFTKRSELKKVPKLGARTFEQAAGFLRIANSVNPLDNTGVHPERYSLVKRMAESMGKTIKTLIGVPELCKNIKLNDYIDAEVGLPTLKDIVMEVEKPGRDPRAEFELFAFSDEVHRIEDLVPGMTLPGIVTNVTAFGAFIDIGVHQDGLCHISQLADTFVKDPNDIVKVNQKISVKIIDIDIKRKRISLAAV
ncbi:MAG: RNA-binding transcriptional accessory protein [Victivallaceae bacterium]|nr:RNA-binding transcriptional accessory protein [Victivallaceae bacterium]